MSEESETSALKILSAKVEELSKTLKEKKEYTEEKIKEEPLAYVAGAFVGGLIVGYLLARKQ